MDLKSNLFQRIFSLRLRKKSYRQIATALDISKNTDPRMIKVFVSFLKVVLKISVSKIKIGLVLYPDLRDEECKLFWSVTAGVPSANFRKTQYIEGRHPTKRLRAGICMVVVDDSRQKTKVLTWIDIFSKQYIMIS